MSFLPVVLFLWGVSLLNATGQLRTFHLINDRKMNFPEALNACRSNYTDLVTIYDEEDYYESVRVLNHEPNAWIGATSCKWSNGDLVTFVNTSTGFTEEKYCGAINTDVKWKFSDCNSTKQYFICYDQDYEQQSRKYRLILENKTWFEAQRYCRENHTDLVNIRDEMENEQVKETLNGSNYFWIGFRYDDGNLYWFDGGHSNYTQKATSKACFTFLASREPWTKMNKNNCFALCYKSFIHVSEYKMRWENALEYCKRNASQLLSIHSEKDQKETERELKIRNISEPVWVGLRQSRVFGFWIWIDGIRVGLWENWKGGTEPQYSHHCGAIEEENGEYKWCDKDCRSEFIAVCVKK